MKAFLISATLLLIAATGCEREVEQHTTKTLAEYLPLAQGKYRTYLLDSSLFTFGSKLEIRRYQEKNVVDTLITDNLGRSGYRIYRFIRDSAGLQPWKASGTYFITPTKNTVEVVENNLRTLKLVMPLQFGYTWAGNTHWPDNAYEPAFEFNNDKSIQLWNFEYGEKETVVINNNVFTDVLPVYHTDFTINASGDFKAEIDTVYATKSFSYDKFAKGIGLVEQQLILWDFQPKPTINKTTNPWTITYEKIYTGFGVKRTLLEYN